MSKTLTIAHRGGTGLRPENTLAAFRNALALGAEALELDVHLTADGVVVVHHDAALRPDTARRRDGGYIDEPMAIADMTYDALRAFDVGMLDPDSAYAKLYPDQQSAPGEPIPRLADILTLAMEYGARVFIEFKSAFYQPDPSFAHEPLVAETIGVVREAGAQDQVFLMSLDWRFLPIAARLAPDIKRSYTCLPGPWLKGRIPDEHKLLPSGFIDLIAQQIAGGPDWLLGFAAKDWDRSLIDLIADQGAAAWSPNHYDVQIDLVAYAHQKGLEVFCWTPDQVEDLRRCVSAGVDGCITDYPDRMINLAPPPTLSPDADFLRKALSFEKAISMGLKSGL